MHRVLVAAGLLAACGDGVTLTDAAIGGDGSTDRGRVSVHVAGIESSGPAIVYFQNADSTLVLATRTNDAGDASALMTSGGFVTAFPQGHLYTWTNVQVGDELVLDLSAQKQDSFPGLTVRIDPLEGAGDYRISSRCETQILVGADTMPVAPFVFPCTPRSDLLLIAYDDVNFQPFRYRYAPDVDMVDSTPYHLGGEYLPIEATVDVIGEANRVVTVRQRLANLDYEASTLAQISDTHVVTPIDMPAIDGTTAQGVAYITESPFPSKNEDATTSELATFAWGPNTGAMTLDFSSPDLREIIGRPELDIESYTLRWTESDAGARGDVVWAQIAIGAGVLVFPWTVMAPRTDETLVRLPVLPYATARLRPDSFVENFALLASDGGYDRLRPYLLGHWSPINATWWPMHEPSGRASYRSVR